MWHIARDTTYLKRQQSQKLLLPIFGRRKKCKPGSCSVGELKFHCDWMLFTPLQCPNCKFQTLRNQSPMEISLNEICSNIGVLHFCAFEDKDPISLHIFLNIFCNYIYSLISGKKLAKHNWLNTIRLVIIYLQSWKSSSQKKKKIYVLDLKYVLIEFELVFICISEIFNTCFSVQNILLNCVCLL